MEVQPLTGQGLVSVLKDVARLRLSVFRAYPYLYDGDLEYEMSYLKPLIDSAGSIVVGAFDDGKLVGAATAAPLADHSDGFSSGLQKTGLDVADIYYLAESVLLPDHRGKGLGHRFFDFREAHGRRLGFKHAVFCSVIRPEDHPDKADYQPLTPFWQKRGYRSIDGALAHFSWKDVGSDEETEKALQIWHRVL